MAAPTSLRFLEGELRRYRQQWRGSVITTFVNPILFLAAMGLGLGVLVDEGAGRGALDGFAYVTFLAPGLLAATTMQTAAFESMWPVMAGIKWVRGYEAAMATPVEPRSIVLGHLGYVTLRVAFAAVVFAAVMSVLASIAVSGAALAVLPGVLTGIAFAAPIMAFTTTRKDAEGLASLYRFGIVPLFLFSGTFFPVEQLPDWMEPVAYATPLWHGVELARAASLDITTAIPWILSVAYLMAWAVAGTALAVRGLEKRMVT